MLASAGDTASSVCLRCPFHAGRRIKLGGQVLILKTPSPTGRSRKGASVQVSVSSSADVSSSSSSSGESIALVVRDGLEIRLPMAGALLY